MATPDTDADVVVVGGGPAGLTAATFTARAGLDTVLYDHGESILARNAHLENVPGFPLGVDPRRFLDLCAEWAERNGVSLRRGEVAEVERDERFSLAVGEGTASADYVVAASWADASYLDGLSIEEADRGTKTFLQPDDRGRTNVPGLYAAGRLAERYHQAVVAAGSGATAALTLIADSEVPFYHDWVVPEGYFTGRGREVPPGCEEIDDEERERRARASRELVRERFAEPHPEEPTMHPAVEADAESDD